jgi:hypothetical protein
MHKTHATKSYILFIPHFIIFYPLKYILKSYILFRILSSLVLSEIFLIKFLCDYYNRFEWGRLREQLR